MGLCFIKGDNIGGSTSKEVQRLNLGDILGGGDGGATSVLRKRY